MIASLWPQQTRQDLVWRAYKVACDISEDRLEGPERKHLVVRHTMHLSGQPDAAACLASLFITQCCEGLLEIGARPMPRHSHTAMSSSRTKWRRMILGRDSSSK